MQMSNEAPRQQLGSGEQASRRPLSLTYRKIESLPPDRRNSRTHPKAQDQIAASINAFGFTNPILVDPAGVIIADHGRLLGAKAAGLTEVPTIELVGLSEAQKGALRLADNKIALGADGTSSC
jgi:ParB-like chromosome segregation protein Spo0J